MASLPTAKTTASHTMFNGVGKCHAAFLTMPIEGSSRGAATVAIHAVGFVHLAIGGPKRPKALLLVRLPLPLVTVLAGVFRLRPDRCKR